MNLCYYKQRVFELYLRRLAFFHKERIVSRKQYEKSMFFVVSAGRSGTTLLRKMLVMGNEVHIPPESDDNIPQLGIWFLRNMHKNWKEKVDRCLDLFSNSKCFEFWGIDLWEEVDDLYRIEKGEQTLFAIIEYIYERHRIMNSPKTSLIGDKTPYLILRLNWVGILVPNARFIHIVRDPRAVVNSRMKVFHEDLESAIDRWMWAVNEFDKLSSSYHKYEVRYEDLILNPEGELRKVCDFLGITFSSSMVDTSTHIPLGDNVLSHHQNSNKRIDPGLIDSWRNELSSKEIDQINARLFSHLSKKNYLE